VTAQHRVRVVVNDVEAGTKKPWREVSVSELEVWGMPPAGWKSPQPPLVPSVEVGEESTEIGDPCADSDRARKQFIAEHEHDVHEGPGGEDHSYPPTCEVLALGSTASMDPLWRDGVAWCEVQDEIYGPTTCHVQFRRGAETAGFSVESPHARARIKVLELSSRNILAGSEAALVVRFESSGGEHVVVCRAYPTLACTTPIQIAADDWKVSFRFDAGQLALDAAGGTPPPGVVGRHPLVYR
jgi:hypothetical protein